MANNGKKITGKTKFVGKITYPAVQDDGFPINYGSSFALELGQFGPAELKKALTDSEMLTSLLRNHPDEMSGILNDVLAGRTEMARQRASTIGLSEEAFQQQGGGFWMAIGIAVCAGIIFAAAATTR